MLSKKIEILIYTRRNDCDKIGKQPSVFPCTWRGSGEKEAVMDYQTMKEIPGSDRPYERCERLGAEALTDAELL